MGYRRPSSAEEALFIPGISAYTESSSFFGFQNPAAANLMTGETVTVVCTCGDAFRVSGSDYSVTLENCTLEPSITAPDTAEPVSEETSITPRPEAAQQ